MPRLKELQILTPKNEVQPKMLRIDVHGECSTQAAFQKRRRTIIYIDLGSVCKTGLGGFWELPTGMFKTLYIINPVVQDLGLSINRIMK